MELLKYDEIRARDSGLPLERRDVALGEKDRDDIRQMIREGKTRWRDILQEWGIFAILAVAASFIVSQYIPAKIGEQTSGLASDVRELKSEVGAIKSDVGEIRKDLKDTLTHVFDRLLSGLPRVPTSGGRERTSESLDIASSAARLAKDLNLGISPVPISAIGLRTLDLARSGGATAQHAWRTTLAYTAYRSMLYDLPRIAGRKRKTGEFDFVISFIHEPPAEVGSFVGGLIWTYGDDVPIEQAARMELIGDTRNEKHTSGPRVIFLNAGNYGLKIDKMWIRNAVIQNTIVAYAGGPVKLDNVRFVSCNFQMPNLQAPQELARLVLTRPSVSIDAQAGE